MAYAVQLPYGGKEQVYLKLGPPVNNNPSSTPAWTSDATTAVSAINGIVALSGLADGQTYYAFEAAVLNSRLSTDTLLAVITPPYAEIAATQSTTAATQATTAATQATTAATQATAAATEIGKVHRSANPVAAGAAMRRNKVAATADTLDETLGAVP
jgi:formylmethanofuran dehydrogenase subunit E-like metal-binding protein